MIYNIEDKYEIRPHGNNLCWEVWEKRAVKDRKTTVETSKWVFSGKYPSNLKHALQIVYELSLKNGEGTIHGLKAAIKHAEEIEQRISAAVKAVD